MMTPSSTAAPPVVEAAAAAEEAKVPQPDHTPTVVAESGELLNMNSDDSDNHDPLAAAADALAAAATAGAAPQDSVADDGGSGGGVGEEEALPTNSFAAVGNYVDKETSSSSFPGDQAVKAASHLTSNLVSSTRKLTSAITHNPVVSNTASTISNTTSTVASSTSSFVERFTTRKYTTPSKTTASQVLMYRQLLHTSCKPGLRLSRAYQGTTAQKAVMHMPWWEQGVEKTGRMVISYDNLITRLWLNGGIMPYVEGAYGSDHGATINGSADLLSGSSGEDESASDKKEIDTLIDDKGLPPIPHAYWVDRLGFQQTDPVTDFRSGGVLSLAMLVHIVEACPHVHSRFLPKRDADMLPFAITCINITDMLAKFLMFSKSVDRIDALLSSKPFWRMFGDPNAMLVLQEVSMDILCDVVVEMSRERKIPGGAHEMEPSLHGEKDGKVTVFDFAEIMERTEKRVRDDLLGAGPKSVDELRAIASRVRTKYVRALERKERDGERRKQKEEDARQNSSGGMMGGAGGFLNKLKSQRVKLDFGMGGKGNNQESEPNSSTEEVSFRQDNREASKASHTHEQKPPSHPVDLLSGDLANTSIQSEERGALADSAGIDASSAFTIDDDDDEIL